MTHFYVQGEPIALSEMATPVFKFYQDVDIIVQNEDAGKEEANLSNLENLWMEYLLRVQAAIFGIIWRTNDAIGVQKAKKKTKVHICASSGYSTRYSEKKISLHFVWNDIHVFFFQIIVLLDINIININNNIESFISIIQFSSLIKVTSYE